MSLTKATYSMISGAPVNILDFGAVGNGTTDDTAAIQAALNYVTVSGADRQLVFPTGSYRVASAVSSSGTTPVLIMAEGQVNVICEQGIGINGSSSALTLATSTVEYQSYIDVADASSVSIGDIIFLSANVIVDAYRPDPIKRTIARVASIAGNRLTLDDQLIFPFSTSDSGISVTRYSPRRVEITGIDFSVVTGNASFRAITLTGVADCFGYQNCSFTTDSNLAGSLDCEMIQASVNVNPVNCRYSNARYGAMRLTTRNCALRGGYGYKLRHLTYPAYWALKADWQDLITESCTAGLDCHSSFNQQCFNSTTLDDAEISDWRSSGCLLENVTINLNDSLAAASENGLVIAPQSWNTGYTYLRQAQDVIGRNVYVNYKSGSAPLSNLLLGVGSAGKVDFQIESNLSGMLGSFGGANPANVGSVIVKSDSIAYNTTPVSTANVIRCPYRLESSNGTKDAFLSGGKYTLFPYAVGASLNAGWRKQETKGRLFSTDTNVSAQVFDCRIYDALDPLANSSFTAPVVIGVLDLYIYGFSAGSARYDYVHYQWSWSHNFTGGTSGQFEPSLRLIDSSTGQAGDPMTFAISATAKSGVPANVGYRTDQYIDFTLTQTWGFSGKLILDYGLSLTQINQ